MNRGAKLVPGPKREVNEFMDHDIPGEEASQWERPVTSESPTGVFRTSHDAETFTANDDESQLPSNLKLEALYTL